MKRIDGNGEIEQALYKAAKYDIRSHDRLHRLWSVISASSFSSDQDPVSHMLSVLELLETAGCPTPGINVQRLSARVYAKVEQDLTRKS